MLPNVMFVIIVDEPLSVFIMIAQMCYKLFAHNVDSYRSHQVFNILAGEMLDKSQVCCVMHLDSSDRQQAQRYDFSAFASRQLAMLIVAYAKVEPEILRLLVGTDILSLG